MSVIITSSRRDRLVQVGCFRGGHNDNVLAIGTLNAYPDRIISTSRDKSMLVWRLTRDPDCSGAIYGSPLKRYTGHSHFVTGVASSTDSRYSITSSWDKNLRLWDMEAGKTTRLFKGHGGDILSVGLSSDNRQVVSGGRDKVVKFWNVVGQCSYTMEQDAGGHGDWVSSVILAPGYGHVPPACFSASWDSTVKMTNLKTYEVERTLGGKGSPVICMELSPDSSLCAIGTKDNMLATWDLENYTPIWSVSMPGEVRAIAFAPHSYQLVAAVNSSIYVYDLINKALVDECTVEASTTSSTSTGNKAKPEILCLRWSTDGNTLFAGYTDGQIRAWKFTTTTTTKMNQEY